MIKTKPFKLMTCILSATLLHACQSPTQEDWAAFCQNDQWFKHGFVDAEEGRPFKVLHVFRDRCGAELSDAEADQYQRGFIKGIQTFCTKQNGYDIGAANKKNPDICPPELESKFLAGYRAGKADYALTVDSLQAAKNEKERLENSRKAHLNPDGTRRGH